MEQNGTPQSSLTERQTLALPYLASASSLAEGGRLADVGRTTLHRWMRDTGFRDELSRLRDEAANLAHAELRGLMLKSVLVLSEALDDKDPAARLRAARATLYVAFRADEARDLRRRLDILDDALALLKRQL